MSKYEQPLVPILFPRQEWADTEWWNYDTKWQRAAGAAKCASSFWYGQRIVLNRRDGELYPWEFKLAVYDRVDQLNRQLRRVRAYTTIHDTVESWQKEIDGLVKLAFDEAVLALPPDGPRTHPPFEEVRLFARAVIECDYTQGKDAKPAFTATGDWDEEPYNKIYRIPKPNRRRERTWRGVEAADAFEKENPVSNVTWMHPRRSAQPEEWRPWKYPVPKDWNSLGPTWHYKLCCMKNDSEYV